MVECFNLKPKKSTSYKTWRTRIILVSYLNHMITHHYHLFGGGYDMVYATKLNVVVLIISLILPRRSMFLLLYWCSIQLFIFLFIHDQIKIRCESLSTAIILHVQVWMCHDLSLNFIEVDDDMETLPASPHASSMVQIMGCRRAGDNPIIWTIDGIILLTHILRNSAPTSRDGDRGDHPGDMYISVIISLLYSFLLYTVF